MPALVLIDGGHERRIDLFRNITRIGSDPLCDVVLQGADIAADHAQLLHEEGIHILMSFGRGKPVLVNGRREKRARLNNGDVIELGAWRLRYTTVENVAPPADSRGNATTLDAYREIVLFSEKLLHSRDLESLLTSLMDALVNLTRADKGFLILFEDGTPQVKVARNIQRENLADAIVELSDSIIAKVVREQQPIIVNDALNDQEFRASKSVLNLRLSSVMCVPLMEQKSLLGILYLGSNRVANLFIAETLHTTNVFAAQASLLIANAMLLNTLRSDNASLRQAMQDKRFGDVIGSCDRMQTVFQTIAKVAATDAPVFITGEPGTGKDLVAAEIHQRSERARQPFIVVNCDAVPEDMLESELFGERPSSGRLWAARGGTLFLNEVCALSLPAQSKLLESFQQHALKRATADGHQDCDIRLIAATAENVTQAVATKRLREDLYGHLNIVSIYLPPLRDRGEDLITIARFLLKKFVGIYNSRVRGFAPHCVLIMKKYGWPGNIRQLENRVKKAVIMACHAQLTAADLDLSEGDLAAVVPLSQAKEDFAARYINEVLQRNNGNRTKAAHDLGVDPRTVFRHLEREEGS